MEPNQLPPIVETTQVTSAPLKSEASHKNLIIIFTIIIVTSIFIIGGLLLAYSQSNNNKALNNQSSSSSSDSESSISSLSSSSRESNLQTFNLKTKPLGSDSYSSTTVDLTLDIPVGFSVGVQDNSSFSLQNSSIYLTVETSAEDSGNLYSQKKTVTNLESDQLGKLYRIVTTSELSMNSLKTKFNVKGDNFYYYTSNYSETGCGPLFDSSTGTTAPAKACGNTNISYTEGSKTQLLSVHCVTSNSTDANVCDQLVEGMTLAIK